MLRKPVVLITGAGGEIGHGLITRLAASGRQRIVTLDLTRLDSSIAPMVTREFTGSILDNALLERILAEFEIDLVFHRRRPERVSELLGAAGLPVIARMQRERDDEEPFPEKTPQAFLVARKPRTATGPA